MLLLGLETSCDETAAAILDGNEVLADVVHSQIQIHSEYGGVVPELAARDHLTNTRPVVERALKEANVSLADIGGIAVTCRPGLSGALLVGLQVARALAFCSEVPLVGVDHLVGHLLAGFLRFPGEAVPPPLTFPFIGLLASGGHTAIYRVEGPLPDQMIELGATRDDAAGEAYDKVSKLLGLGYPGGPIIDRLAKEGDPNLVELSAPMPQKTHLEFSFSGLKTNVSRLVTQMGTIEDDANLRNLCAAFQRRVVESLLGKAFLAAESEGIRTIVIAGGVAANSALRAEGAAEAARRGMQFLAPCRRACTDNAAMIAYAGSFLLAAGRDNRHDITMSPKTELQRKTRKGGGPRPLAS